jgi:hypothetical protein
VASEAFAPRRLRIGLALSKSRSREARGIEGRASAERCVHLQAILQKARESAPSQLHFKGFRRDGFLKHRA